MSSDDYILGPLLDNAKCTNCDEEFHPDEKHRCKPHMVIHKTITEIMKRDEYRFPRTWEQATRIYEEQEKITGTKIILLKEKKK